MSKLSLGHKFLLGRLSLEWVTSENSTMLLGSDILRLFFTGPYLVSSPLCSVSGVDCPSVDPRQLPLLLSNYQLPPVVSCRNSQLCLLGRVVHSRSPPRTTSGYGEISCPRILCLVSRQNRQLNRLLWQPTHIVLQIYPFNNEQTLTRSQVSPGPRKRNNG